MPLSSPPPSPDFPAEALAGVQDQGLDQGQVVRWAVHLDRSCPDLTALVEFLRLARAAWIRTATAVLEQGGVVEVEVEEADTGAGADAAMGNRLPLPAAPAAPTAARNRAEPAPTARLWPAPTCTVSARPEVVRALARSDPSLGPVQDATVPPGSVRLALSGILEYDPPNPTTPHVLESPEPEAEAETVSGTQFDPTPVAWLDIIPDVTGYNISLQVTALRGAEQWVGRAIALLMPDRSGEAVDRITDALEGVATEAKPPPSTASTASAAEAVAELAAWVAAYQALCQAYRETGETRRPSLTDFAACQFLSAASVKRRLKALSLTWRQFIALAMRHPQPHQPP